MVRFSLSEMISLISDFFLERLKNSCLIEDFVASYVELKPTSNGRLAGLCPFHIEKSPSMMIYLATQSFYCFGCGSGGDVVSFAMKIENLEYIDALKFLSRRAGIPFPEMGIKHNSGNMRQRILAANKAAAHFFYDSL